MTGTRLETRRRADPLHLAMDAEFSKEELRFYGWHNLLGRLPADLDLSPIEKRYG